MSIRVKGKQINITITQCYAPNNHSEEESKMGDLNAKVRSDNTNHDRAMGKEGGSMNYNGERLLAFCTTYDLVIGGTLFPRQEIHPVFP